MRIISQNGIYDLPYDKCLIWADENEIMACPIGEPYFTMAIYSTQEKIEKAMQLLHEAYSGMENSVLTKTPNEPSKVEHINNAVFRFPKEGDL